jgi:F-type H+-transporting ATPase subunit b
VRRALGAAALAGVTLCAAGTAWASSEGESVSATEMLWHALNLALILGIILYFARKPVAEYLEQRRQGIEKNLETSARVLEEAESKLAAWNERAARLDAEVGQIRETSRRLAEEERDKILAQARATAERIRSDAQAAVDQELRRARAALSAEAADLAVDLAARLISERVSDDDQKRLFDEFLTRVEGPAEGPVAGGRGD